MNWKDWKSPEKRFWSRVRRTKGCWIWLGPKHKRHGGYGKMNYKSKTWSAHRLSWFLSFGEIPDGLHVLHKCDKRYCVNPDHLFLGTPADNIKDMIAKGRKARQGLPKSNSAKLTWSAVRNIRKDQQRGMTTKDLASKYKVSKTCILDVVNKKSWVSTQSARL